MFMEKQIDALLVCFTCLCLSWLPNAEAAEVKLAVANNFRPAMKELASQFQNDSSHKTIISYASSGTLFSQIKHGAPFEVFLSADTQRALQAEMQGLAVPSSLFVYAKGKLVLWSATQQAFTNGQTYLQQRPFKRFAIANPKIAPYGLAAQQALLNLHIWQPIQSKLVRGESIAQAFQFVATGNAEAGLLAYSQIKNYSNQAGSLWMIPNELYGPIKQAAVLLNTGEHNPAALAFIDFMKSATAQQIIRNHGYAVEKN